MESQSRRRLWFWLGPAVAVLLCLCVDIRPGQPQVTQMAAVAAWMAIWWLSEAVELAVTALLPLVLFPFLGLLSHKDVGLLYLDHNRFLFIGSFVVALALERVGLHQRIALQTVLLFGASPRRLLLGFLLATGFLSFWMANTAATMIMIPPVLAVLGKLEENHSKEELKPLGVALLLAVAYAASIGGVGTLIGTPTNLVLVRTLHKVYPAAPELSFVRWMLLAAPLSAVMLLAAWGVLSFLYLRRVHVGAVDRQQFREEYHQLGPPTYDQKVVLVVAELMAFMWIFRADVDLGSITVGGWSGVLGPKADFLGDSTVAMLAALVLLLVPSRARPGRTIMTWGDLRDLPWGIVLLLGGGLALASGFQKSGLSDWCGETLQHLGRPSPFHLAMIVCFLLVFLTEFTANTSTVELVLPILAALAAKLHYNPLFLMVPATICASMGFMMPAGTPPNAIVFSTGRVSVWQMATTGILLNITGAVLTTVAILTWGRHVLGADLLLYPPWAR
ncbi:MAG: SLC13/DASS family transporter [Armatimonadetes bacterium]|nr:SLC13/DASS family transporter [Armatimonadota bacterium]